VCNTMHYSCSHVAMVVQISLLQAIIVAQSHNYAYRPWHGGSVKDKIDRRSQGAWDDEVACYVCGIIDGLSKNIKPSSVIDFFRYVPSLLLFTSLDMY